MHAKIQDISGSKIKCSSPGCIKSKGGTVLIEKKEILNSWSEYYVEELSKRIGTKYLKEGKSQLGPTILQEEVETAAERIKNGKATGSDNMPIEIITALDNLEIDRTTKLFNAIYDIGTIPKDLSKSLFVVLSKRPGAKECKLHRAISLMSHFTKILLRVLMHRMRKSLRLDPNRHQTRRSDNTVFLRMAYGRRRQLLLLLWLRRSKPGSTDLVYQKHDENIMDGKSPVKEANIVVVNAVVVLDYNAGEIIN
ncbi:endonuclease-reverse transcriptase [Plakobranchus ocellatus]|uniref:Endonuclease-reverse transcriptase n=1 Tax=Plakobranchus ocellatus TaxID=259542 RepID=A0AAV4CWK4_9GAST|nr:endonuclease-reverse transcriptase [Plakobranchus ocellatus]